MSSLSEKLRRARESDIAIDGHTYTIRRPTDVDAIEFHQQHTMADAVYTMRLAERFVIGWDFSEVDAGVPGGSGERVPFDAEAWGEYLAIHPDLWAPIASAILDAFNANVAKRQANEKNSSPG